MIAFSYYRQLLDPTSPANALRAPSNQVRMGAFPAHYTPPYNPHGAPPPGPGYPYPVSGQYAHEDYVPPYGDDGKPPGYGAGAGGPAYAEKGARDDPFADNDGPSTRAEARDGSSRPADGGYRL